jgi:hypothetical protein
MNLKSISIGVAALAIIAVAGWWFSRPADPKQDPGDIEGGKLLDADLLAKTEQIVLFEPFSKDTVTLEKQTTGEWILPDYHQFEIDFSKVKTLSNSLLNANVLRFVTRNPERLKNLELGKKQITLKGAGGETLWALETGKRGSSGGTYVRIGDTEEAWLSDLSFYLDTSESNWPNKRMLNFQSGDVSALTIEFTGGDPPVVLTRETAESDFQAEGLAENEQLKTSEVTTFLNSLLNARFNNVHEPDEPDVAAARGHSRSVSLKLFNGDGYSVAFGRKPAELIEKEPVTDEAEEADDDVPSLADADTLPESADILASQDDQIAEDEETDATEEPKMTEPGPVFFFYQSINPSHKLNALAESVALEFSSYVYDQFPDSRGKLVEKVEPVATSDTAQEAASE